MSSTARQRKNVPDYGIDESVKYKMHREKVVLGKPSMTMKLCLVVFICGLIILASCIVLFLSDTSKNYPVPFKLPIPPKLNGALAPNDLLKRSKRIFKGNVHGPEFLVFNDDFLYTGTSDGKILRISKNKEVEVVAKLGKEPCGQPENEPTCGRPLGLEFDSDGYLVICDAYLGLFKLDVNSGEIQELLPASTSVGGQRLNFLNDLEIHKDGDIYLTQSSTNYQRNDYMSDIFYGSPSGRLLRFDPVSGEVKVILDNINFANGVLLSEFNDFILVSETSRARILKHHIRGINAGRTEMFLDNMPCLPDNLHRDRHTGNIWVACSHLRHSEKLFNFLDFLQERTWLRRFLMELPMSKVMHYFYPGAMLIEISNDGKILSSFMDENNVVAGRLSHAARDAEGKFYFGSYVDDYIVVFDQDEKQSKFGKYKMRIVIATP